MFYKWTRGHTQLFWEDKDQNIRQKKLNDLLEKYFGQITNGTFIEIGANDGINCGVCLPLADVGWTGHCFEPDPGSFKKCVDNHKMNEKVSCYNIAVSDKNEQVKLRLAGMGSTTSDEYFETAKNISWSGLRTNTQTIIVEAVSLNDICEKHINNQKEFEVLSIDVEGSELEILKAFDFEKWRPKIIFIELTDEHPDFQKYPKIIEKEKECRRLIESKNYSLIHKDNINSVYVLKEN